MKRFWTKVTVVPQDGQFAITLDGKPMSLAGGPPLRVSSARLAEALACEWSSAKQEWSLEDIYLTRLVGTAQTQIAPDPAPTIAMVAAYAETDLLCYRAELPTGLATQQREMWQPWLDWAVERFDAPLLITNGTQPIDQPAASLAALCAAVAVRDAFALTGLGVIVPCFGSLILGLAVLEGAVEAEHAYELSILDERFQENLWGTDRDARARRRMMRRHVVEAARLMALSRG